jgi:hypothetical protein
MKALSSDSTSKAEIKRKETKERNPVYREPTKKGVEGG